ncbi:MAG: three-Cys-motif partner protein TcmP [Proteobacteria bacterium]|nr:three-Cys-motif partner protein TcmP [Pseudomonadota bacterium]
MRGYDWSKGQPPLLDEHSAAKHTVLRRYVENYIQILCCNPKRTELRLTVVDGFCGGGVFLDKDANLLPGSPLILLEALQKGRAEVRRRRTELGIKQSFELHAQLHLNDISHHAIGMLRRHLPAAGVGEWQPQIHVANLDFQEAAARLIASYRGARSSPRILFVLDQYGFSDASLPVMQSIFAAFPKAEIVLTVAIDTLVNFASPNTLDLYQKVLAKAGFDAAVTAEHLASIKEEEDGAKHIIQTLFLKEVFPRTGASFATPFFIIPRKSRRGYWLLHLANNMRANDEMKQLHWETKNHFMHFGHEGIGILAFDPLRLVDTSQSTFDFGDFAQQRSQDALKLDLPRLITNEFPDGTTIRSLLARVANDSPATAAMVREQVFSLGQDRELDVRTIHWRQRKNAQCLHADDEIHPRRQFTLI